MKILRSRQEAEEWRSSLAEDVSIGFVPTMGALHQAHISLFLKAKQENDMVIGSIFVNPTQFNNLEDLQKYPRTEEEDIRILERNHAVDALFLPKTEDMYPNGSVSAEYEFDGLELVMEGAFRPGHFQGVATIVEEFFKILHPTKAYFGEKDFQQLKIIEKTVAKKNIPVKICPVEIMREAHGLAMSSRNERLSTDARQAAKIIYEALLYAKKEFRHKEIPEIRAKIEKMFLAEEGFELEYFTIAEADTLQPTEFSFEDRKYRAFIAAYTENVRLIDNIDL